MKVAYLIIVFNLIATFAFAHKPGKIELSADIKNKILTVKINHRTKDVATHFISRAEIFLNGQKVGEIKFTSQTSLKNNTFTQTLEEMKQGDKIEVICTCSESGQGRASLEIVNKKR